MARRQALTVSSNFGRMKKLLLIVFFSQSVNAMPQSPYKNYRHDTIGLSKKEDSLQRFIDTFNFKHYFDSLANRPVTLLNRPFLPFSAYSDGGQLLSEKNLTGKITFVNFWFEACLPCRAEINPLKNLYATFKNEKDFQFLSFTYESSPAIARIKKEYNIKYPIIHLRNDSCYLLNFNSGFPTTMIIDPQGKTALYLCGGKGEELAAEKQFQNEFYPVIRKLLKIE